RSSAAFPGWLMASLVRLEAARVFGAKAGMEEGFVDTPELFVADFVDCLLCEREERTVAGHEQSAGAVLVDPRVGVVRRSCGEPRAAGALRPERRGKVATILAPAEIGGAVGRVVMAVVAGRHQELGVVILPQPGDGRDESQMAQKSNAFAQQR